MSFLAQEQGVATASPQELFEIRYEAVAWYYTSGDAPHTDPLTGRVYEPMEIERTNVSFTSDPTRSTLEVTVRRDAPFLDIFRLAPPSSVVSLTVKRVHRTDVQLQAAVIWKGRILNVEWTPSVATITCESIRSSVQRNGLRRCFQLQCPHVLYGPACTVSKALWETIGQVTSVVGNTVVVGESAGTPDNYWAGGYIQWVNATLAATERRTISASDPNTGQLTLIGAAVGLAAGDEVRMYPGCDHTLGENGCQRFNNVPNYGGFPYTPRKSPFTGDPLY